MSDKDNFFVILNRH